jgi:Ran GTPase-activating protein (RanGAP) involved in mRNA processing and transport
MYIHRGTNQDAIFYIDVYLYSLSSIISLYSKKKIQFLALKKKKKFENLNLSNCKIGILNCYWGGNLDTFLSLITLNLSYNKINDNGLENLAVGIKNNCTLRYLDISYNIFGRIAGGGVLVGGLASIIKFNRILTNLNLAGNCMLSPSWSSIATGFFDNETLLNLDVSYVCICTYTCMYICIYVHKYMYI